MFICEKCAQAQNEKNSRKILRASGTPEDGIAFILRKNQKEIRDLFDISFTSYGPCEHCHKTAICIDE